LLATAAIFALCGAGCGSTAIQLGETVASPRQGQLGLRWRRELNDASTLDWASIIHGGPAFDQLRDRVFVGGMDNALRAFRANDGAMLWRFQALGRVDSTPVISDENVIFGAGDGAVYSISAETGRLAWRTLVGAEVTHAAVRFGETILVVTGADAIVALDRITGDRRWTYRRTPAGGISSSGHAGLTLVDGKVYSGFSDGTVACLDAADGSVVWEQDTAADFESAEGQNEGHQAIDVDTTPLVVRDTVYVASQAVGMLALDALSGARRWTAPRVTGVTSMESTAGALIVGSTDLGVLRVNSFDGTVVWARDVGSRSVQSIAVLWGGRVAVSCGDAGLWIVRAADGEIVDGLRPGRGISAPIARSEDRRLFVHSNSDILYVLDFTG
jgi:outer membrane protein assembly factor BamB